MGMSKKLREGTGVVTTQLNEKQLLFLKLNVDMGHVRGGWSGHVGLVITGRSQQQLHALGLACIEAICPHIFGTRPCDEQRAEALDSPHISLTRAFYVQEHQIAGFMSELEASIRGTGALTVGFGALRAFANERGDREFVAVEVAAGRDSVQAVLERVDHVMERFGKPRFFADARFHASIVRLDTRDASPRSVQRAADRLGAQMDEEILRLPAARIDTLECVFGDRCFHIALNQ
ncbi:poly(U)-specific 3'-to-5' RNA exonuclease [Coemansia sp. RSA 1822]|nr:poly(U)-specific 3'-to-5' RNA exonuclease [Coemansia sp. RSA 638]KAJ2124511.1 poly(U)-specific 3'-to-5' RNA exonuclease [Coemansia sp. RSA 720]KAJ2544528.1 poly(U)-specific 3'-to-5' RNA exonuclease [Coemansia sp. RSA 1853]KAJ2563889.1 poly(U)-specific 3'-to-5' RNA exonuclease [Coemansia sp. RSA 1822]